jgi:hypothetical protein
VKTIPLLPIVSIFKKMSGDAIVCLSSTPFSAFLNVPIEYHIDSIHAIPATISATTTTLTFNIPIPDNGGIKGNGEVKNDAVAKGVAVDILWKDVLMHSIIDDVQMMLMVKIESVFNTPDYLLGERSEILKKIISENKNKNDEKNDEKNNIENNNIKNVENDSLSMVEEDNESYYDNDGDDAFESDTYTIIFSVSGPPQSHFELLPEFHEKKDTFSGVEMKIENVKNNSNVALLYQLFNQCVCLNPEDIDQDGQNDNNMLDIDGFGYGNDDYDGDLNSENFENFDGMYTAEYFDEQDRLNGINDEDDEARYKR